MERRFDTSDFEQTLKDYADQFKMMPSKRAWNGIYNHLHPGSKWPSITVGIIFIITLVLIGNLNNSSNRLKKASVISSNATTLTSDKTYSPKAKNSENKEAFGIASKKSSVNTTIGNSDKKIEADNKINSGKNADIQNIGIKKTENTVGKTNTVSINDPLTSDELNKEKFVGIDNSTVNKQITGFLNSDASGVLAPSAMERAFLINEPVIKINFQEASSDHLSFIPNRAAFSTGFVSQAEKIDLKDNAPLKKAQKNSIKKKTSKKKNSKIQWLYYVEPTISYITLHSKDVQSSTLLSPSSLVVLTNQSPFKLVRNPRPGLEAGAQFNYSLSKKLQFISGVNFSYSAYSNISNLVHPTFASLILKDNSDNLYTKNFITHYGNGESQSVFPLVNYRLAAGIPVGFQYSIWKNEKLSIDISSAVEPLLVLKSNAYVISADGRYYINDPALLRKVNLDGKFGSYLSFHSKKIKWYIGPDIRYQMFSTYKDIYPTREHFFDYGIRIGISK